MPPVDAGAPPVDAKAPPVDAEGAAPGVAGQAAPAGGATEPIDDPNAGEPASPTGNSWSSISAAVPWICTVYGGNPCISSGYTIKGSGSQVCSGPFASQRTCVQVQQYRGLGYWSTKADSCGSWTSGSTSTHTAGWVCPAGSGSQLYRTRTRGQVTGSAGNTYTSLWYLGRETRFFC